MSKPFTDTLNHPFLVRFLPLAKKIAVTGFAQALIQGIGFISGILIIRLLPTEEYALYTLANTMLGTMTVLADGGISTGVMAQGGKVWQDKEKLGIVLATGLELRRKFALGSIAISVPILLYLLHNNGASWPKAILIVLALIPAFLAALSDSLLEIVPKLHQAIIPLQKNQVYVSIGRLFLSGLSLFLFPWTFIAILASGIPRIWGNIQLRFLAGNYIKSCTVSDEVVRGNILNVVKRVLPGAFYYCLSGQITIWVVSFFGKSKAIAEIGALGRIGVILGLASAILSILIVPRFSILPISKKVLLEKFFLYLLLSSFICFGILLLSMHFSSDILWFLGEQYKNLKVELLMTLLASCLNLVGGIAFLLYSSKGWIIHPLLSIILSLVPVVIAALLLDLSETKQVLLLNIASTFTFMLLHTSFGAFKILSLNKNQ